MRQSLLDGDLRLAGLGERRPDLSDRLVVSQPALVHEAGDHQGGHGLGGGKQRGQGVGGERLGARPVGVAGPQVDDQLAVPDQGKPRAELCALREIGLEGGGDGLEAWGDVAADLWDGGGGGQFRRSMRTCGEVAFRRWAMATRGSSLAFHIWAAETVSATPPTARGKA